MSCINYEYFDIFFHFQAPICNLNLCLQPDITPETGLPEGRVADFQTNIRTIREAGYGKFDTIHKADLKISDIGNLLGSDWVKLAHELEIPDSDINIIKTEYPENEGMYSMFSIKRTEIVLFGVLLQILTMEEFIA
jgi:hypothetical protein